MKITGRSFVLIALAAALGLGATNASAQESGNWNQDYDPYVAAIGLSVGLSSGTGLSIRWPALPQTMMSLAGGLWGKSEDLAWNVGLEAHYILRQAGRLRLFTGPAVALYSDGDDDESNVNVSAGIGLEYLLRTRLSVKLDLGFTYQSDDGEIYPLPQIAAFLYF